MEVGGDQGGKRSVGGKSDSAAFEKDGLAAQCTEWILDELEEGDRPIFQEFQSLFSWNSPLDKVANLNVSSLNGFQSLFSWNSPLDGAASDRRRKG